MKKGFLTFGDQAASTVNSGRVELNELEVLKGKANTSNHGVSITSASVRRGAGEVGSSISLMRRP